MNERTEMLDNSKGLDFSRTRSFAGPSDFGPVVLIQGQTFTFVSFGLLVGLGAFLGMVHIWFYLSSYHILPSAAQANKLALTLALGAPLSAYIITRLLDIKAWLSGEKKLIEYIRTVSFGLWGGLLGGLSILVGFSLIAQTPFLALLDAFALGVPLAQVMGRIGCLNYGCCHGVECSSKTQPGIRYYNTQTKVLRYEPKLRGKRLHPTQIYSAAANLTIYLIILVLWLAWDTRPIGILAASYMTLYGLKRFSVEFFRGEFPRVYFYGLTLWQWFSLSFVFLGLATIVFVMINGQAVGPSDFNMGIYGLKASSVVLLASALIMGLVYGTHGKKIGSW